MCRVGRLMLRQTGTRDNMGLKEAGLRGSLRNISSVSAIPDSGDLHARYDATTLSLTDGQSVSTWTDETGNGHDLTAGTAPTYVENVINGNSVVRFDGVDDFLNVIFGTTLTQPNTIFAVVQSQTAQEDNFQVVHDGTETGSRHLLVTDDNASGDDWRISAGTNLDSGTVEDTNPHIFSELFDSTTSELRLDGTQIASGDAGTDSLTGFQVASTFLEDGFGDYDIGEILIYPQDKSAIYADVESYLSDKWGITI